MAQEVDPSVICPLVRACPANERNVEVFMEAKPQKANCALCLFAVTKLEEDIEDKHSKVCNNFLITIQCKNYLLFHLTILFKFIHYF